MTATQRVTAAQQQTRSAFTLLEVVLVIAIVAVVAAVALPRYARSLSHQRAAAAANRIVTEIARVQNLARLTSQTQTITFDAKNATYQISGLMSDDRPSQKHSVALSDEPYLAVVASADFGGKAMLSFDGFGNPLAGGQVVLGSGDVRKTVTVDATTGRTKVE